MKTHQEIRDAINMFKLDLGAGCDGTKSVSGILRILHAMNDRIETLREISVLQTEVSQLDRKRLEKIHPTIT